MLAWIGRTLVKLLLAVAPRVAQWALAVMGIASIDTDTRVLAQVFNRYSWTPGNERSIKKSVTHTRFKPSSNEPQLVIGRLEFPHS